MGVWRVPIVLEWGAAGSPGVNVWTVRTQGFSPGDEPGDLQGAIDALHTFYDGMAVYMAPAMRISLGEVVERTSQERGAPTFTPMTVPNTGGEAPQVLQACISWRTTLAARRGMGRTFIGPLASGVLQDDGTPTQDFLTGAGALTSTLVADSLSSLNGWAIAVWGLQDKAPKGTTDYAALPHVARDITDWRIRDQFAVLRSRRD